MPNRHQRRAAMKQGHAHNEHGLAYGRRYRGRLLGCIMCNNNEGHTFIIGRWIQFQGRDAMRWESLESMLCPTCKSRLDDSMRRELDFRSDYLLESFKRRMVEGDFCPLCCGIAWHDYDCLTPFRPPN